MVPTTPADEGSAEICAELQALLLAETAAEQRDCLLRSFARLQVAGFCHFDFQPSAAVKASVRVHSMEDLSGALTGLAPTDVADAFVQSTPAWLASWILRRKRPFWLHGVTRYIPFSTTLILHATAPAQHRRLVDFVVVTYPGLNRSEGMMAGLHRQASETDANQLITIASAYLAKQPTRQDEPISADRTTGFPTGKELNQRQLECLQWLVAGKSLEEVAQITGINYDNIRYHLNRAKKQTGLASLQQLLVYAAVEHGLSPMGPEHGQQGKRSSDS